MGGLATPYVAQVLMGVSLYGTVCLYAAMAVTAGILAFFLPIETRGRALEDLVDENAVPNDVSTIAHHKGAKRNSKVRGVAVFVANVLSDVSVSTCLTHRHSRFATRMASASQKVAVLNPFLVLVRCCVCFRLLLLCEVLYSASGCEPGHRLVRSVRSREMNTEEQAVSIIFSAHYLMIWQSWTK